MQASSGREGADSLEAATPPRPPLFLLPLFLSAVPTQAGCAHFTKKLLAGGGTDPIGRGEAKR